MKLRWRFQSLFLSALLLAAPLATVFAQQDDNNPAAQVAQEDNNNPAGQASSDPPGRVARLEYLSGEVSMQPGGVNDWIAASQNRPLTTSDRVWTDKNARAELDVGNAFIRMNSETSLTLTNVSDNTVQLELDQGVLNLSVRYLDAGEIYEVDTPNFAFTVMKPGFYRFDVYPNEDQSWVTVRSGYGEATGQGNAVRVNSGEQVRFNTGTSLAHTAESAPARDGFDDWARVRDERLEHSASARYVSPGVIGYQDLDAYGYWRDSPEYGNVWVPYSVAPGWAPYRFGHWVWIDPWGWTWVDDAPWGFAPFHYGRWVWWGGAWGWAPGPIGFRRPYYAPALVGWIGGGGFGIGFGFGGGCGWFPLGWGEPFYPWYGGYRGGRLSSGYVRNVNITNTNITNITNVTNNYYNNRVPPNARFRNRTVPGAVTAAPRSALASGQAINKVGRAVPKAELGRGQLVRNIDVKPTREAMLGGHKPLTRGLPPASAVNRPVVTRARPPARTPVSRSVAERTGASPNPSRNVPQGRPGNAPRTTNPASTVRSGEISTPAHNVPRPPTVNTPPRGNSTTATRGVQANPTAHPVPRPPSGAPMRSGDTGNTVRNNRTTAPEHNVPRPPVNGSYSRGNKTSEPVSTGVHPAPRSPAASQPYHAPASVAPRPAPAPHNNAPAVHAPNRNNAPASREPSKSESKDKGPGMVSRVPRPPAGYSYRSAPSYSARGGNSSSGASRSGSYAPPRPYSSARGSYAPAPSYSRARGSYSPAPSYGSGRSYSPAPTYSSRSSAPAYSAPRSSAPASSAPRYSSAPSGGYRSSGGGGYRSSGSSASRGGGGSRASSGRGGGHHG
jgi:Family of unknown function (DUF6600)